MSTFLDRAPSIHQIKTNILQHTLRGSLRSHLGVRVAVVNSSALAKRSDKGRLK